MNKNNKTSTIDAQINSLGVLEKPILCGFFDDNEAGGILVDDKGIILSASPGFLAISGQNKMAVQRENIAAFIGKNNAKRYLNQEYFSQNKKFTFECFWKSSKHSGIYLKIKVICLAIKSKKLIFIAKRANPVVASKSKIPTQIYLEQIIENMNASMWLRSRDGNQIYYASPNFEKMFELTFEDIQESPQKLFERVHPEDYDQFMRYYHGDSPDFAYRYLLRDGTVKHISVHRSFLKDNNGNTTKVASIAVDDTNLFDARQKAIEQQKELVVQNAKLARINKTLEDFTTFACHDLSQPLRVFFSYLKILEREHLKEINAEGQHLLSSLYNAIRKMKSLIQGMADLSLIEQIENVDTELDVNLVFKEVMETIDVNMGAKVETGYLHPLKISKDHLVSLLQNLIENGIKYNINIPHIKITSKKFKSGIVYAIRDNGIGIPEEAYNQIFNLGRRLNTLKKEGSGIGLSACKKIMSLYEGETWVYSKQGEGSIFYLFFPSSITE